jgi:hypothetical protein
LIRGAFPALRPAFATSQRQKCDDGDEEKFDCDERARRFDLIRPLRPSASIIALSEAPESSSASTMTCARSTTSILGSTQKTWAERESPRARATRYVPASRAHAFTLGRGCPLRASTVATE